LIRRPSSVTTTQVYTQLVGKDEDVLAVAAWADLKV